MPEPDGPDGTVYIAEDPSVFTYGGARIDRVDAKTGVISIFAGARSAVPGSGGVGGTEMPLTNDGEAAATAFFTGVIEGMVVDPAGELYFTDYSGHAVYEIDTKGIVHLVAGGASSLVTVEQDGVPAVGSLVWQPQGIALHPNGNVLFQDYGTGSSVSRIREIASPFPSFVGGTLDVPSRDGTELYVFQEYGQHLATLDPVTGATLRTFQYDAQSRLTSVTETRGGTTTFAYAGNTILITPPFSKGGQRTVITLDSTGHASAFTTPEGETTELTYSNGLLTSLLDPRSYLHTFAYDGLGRLLADTDPTGATIRTSLHTRVPGNTSGSLLPYLSWSTDLTSAAGYVTKHQDFTLGNGTVERAVIAPSGAKSSLNETTGELWTSVAPDGTLGTVQQLPDPQFGMLSPYAGTTTRTTPSGLSYSSVRTRTSTGSTVAPSTITDLTTINGQTEPWSQVFSAVTGTTPANWLFRSPVGRERLQTLDALGRVSSISFPGTSTLPTTSFAYDADGRVSSVTVTASGGASTRVTTNSYDTYLAGYLATSQDPAGNVTTYDQRDQDGRVLDVELPDFAAQPLSHVGTTYDGNGNVTSVTVPPATSLSSTHSFTSTPVDLLDTYTPPQVSSSSTGNDPELATLATSYAYNADRQLTTEDVPEGTAYQAVTKGYDSFGRLSTSYDPLSNVTASYEYVLNASNVSTDQVSTITTSDGITLTNTFDGFLKTKTAWTSGSVTGSVSWTYDSFFRPSTLQVSSASPVTFAYDADRAVLGPTTCSGRIISILIVAAARRVHQIVSVMVFRPSAAI